MTLAFTESDVEDAALLNNGVQENFSRNMIKLTYGTHLEVPR